jgi:L-lactate dehydrogenase complex protein LldE
MRVVLFIPCFIDALFPETGKATVRVLRRAAEILDEPLHLEFPRSQTCCGQIHNNSGERARATRLLRHFLDVFESDEPDWIVCPSASCTAMVRDQYPILAGDTGDPGLVRAVSAVAPRLRELTSFLVSDLGIVDLGAHFPHKVVLHPTCHSTRFLGLGAQPMDLLRSVAGLEVVHHADPDECCGFGGTFAVKNPETSSAMMEDKLDALEASGAEFITAVDDSCLMHLEGGLRRRGSPLRTLHLARILDPAGGP